MPYEKIKTKECIETCTIEELIDKQCKINKFTENNIDIFNAQVRSLINNVTDSNYDVIIDGNNLIYEVISSTARNDYRNVSLIDFGECERILKQNESLDYLIIFKMDIKLNDSYPTVVEYEVYSPKTKQLLNLSLCKDTKNRCLCSNSFK